MPKLKPNNVILRSQFPKTVEGKLSMNACAEHLCYGVTQECLC